MGRPKKETKQATATLAIRVDEQLAIKWRAYCAAGGYGEAGRITEEALKRFMRAHPLRGEKRACYLNTLENYKRQKALKSS